MDAGRASSAREHFKKAGVDGLITIVLGDAHANVSRLEGPIDVLFLDADKEGYVDYWNKMFPLVRPSGLILAHNLDMIPNYIKLVTTNAGLETVVYMEGKGLAITLKKRD
jgi:predicted O-methyltransferase YrrM